MLAVIVDPDRLVSLSGDRWYAGHWVHYAFLVRCRSRLEETLSLVRVECGERF